MTAEETWRLFSCQWCGLQVRLCRWCDRGLRYCGSECAVAQRQEAQRAASAAYQMTERGAKLHATRMQRYRDRHAMMRAWRCTLRVTQHEAKLLLTMPEQGDLLEARLDPRPSHPRALLTMLEGLSLWSGQPLCVALHVDERSLHGPC
jgi:hypothetical protein